MDKPKPQARNGRRPAKTLVTSTIVAPSPATMLTSKGDGGSGRVSSASGSVVEECSSSRAPVPDAAGPLPSSSAVPKYRYSREELLNLMNSPQSKIKPEICSSLHKLFDCIGRESDSSSLTDQASVRQAMTIRKHLNLGGEPQSFANQVNVDHDVDPHIVLVPRRLSFSTGCHGASSGSVNSPDLKRERNRRDGHRIGSGRIQISEKHLEQELRDHRAVCDREQNHDNRRYDRSGSSGVKVLKRDYEGRRQEGGRGGRYVGGSRSGREDPEWFTDGPVSRSDTIELWDFDQGHGSRRSLKDGVGSDVSGNVSKHRSAGKQNTEVYGTEPFAKEPGRSEVVDICAGVEGGEKSICEPSVEKNSPLGSASSNQQMHEGGKDPNPGAQKLRPSSSPGAASPLQNANAEMDFNAIFNIDSIPGLSEMFGMEPEQTKAGGSRFKQWFHFGSHGNSHCDESRRSSLTDEFGYINDIICGHSSPLGALSPPLPQSVYSTAKCSSETQNLMDLLKKAHGDAAGAVRNGSTMHGVSLQHPADSANTGTSFNHLQQNPVGSMVDARTVEAGLKVILGGSVLSNSLLSALPSMAHLGSLVAGPPPSGAKVLLAEELEAQLVTASSDRSESSCAATASSISRQSNCKTSADISLTPSRLTSWSGSNSGNLSFCSLPVLPIGTKVTLLSELEAGLGGLNIAGRATVNRQPPDGSTDGALSLLSAAGRPVLSHGSGVSPAMLSVNAFNNRMTDLGAYKKLLGLVMDPHSGQTATGPALPIVTSPTSVSMSSLEANQPNNSLANNQRDFIQRYLLQQQQLKMLNRSQPLQSEGMVLAPSGITPHILPTDHPHPLYMTSGSFVDHVPSGQAMTPSGQGANVPPLFDPSFYGRTSTRPLLNLQAQDDLSLLSGGLPSEFCGGHFVVGSHPLPSNGGQLYQSRGGGGGGGVESRPTDGHSLLQCLESMGGKHLLHHPPVNHAIRSHNAALHNQQQQQQAAKMMHLMVQNQFANSVKAGLTKPANQSPVPPPRLTLQPPIARPSAAVGALPSPGIPILAPQTLLQHPPQSPRQAPSPLMFGSQPPMNLTAPLPVHLGPMTPVLSPTLSPNMLQVTQPGSNLSSPVMRVPSPQELSGLAQSILQNALIKKQLEEQKERFIRRQQERNKSPRAQSSQPVAGLTTSNSKPSSIASASTTITGSIPSEAGKALPSPFLPTSVLRKMVTAKMEEKLAGRSGEVEKSVPLLKIIKPDEEGEEADEEADSKADQNVLEKVEGQNGTAKLVADDQLSAVPTKCGLSEDNYLVNPPARELDVASSTDAGRRLSLTSAGCSLDETGLRLSAARRLIGQGLMNLNSSPSLTDAPCHQVMVEPVVASPPFPAVAGFVSSGRQIKGKKLSEHLSVGLPLASGVIRNTAGHQLNALKQQQLHQVQFLMANSGTCRPGVGASVNTLHALEMSRNLGLVSPVPVLPQPAPPPSVAMQFVPSMPVENGSFGVKQLPRMMVPPPFGVNSPTSNALLLQSLSRSNLQRAALSSVNRLNINQLALIQAIQLQAQQQQQQQQQMWSRNPARPPTSNRPTCPAFMPPNQPSTSLSSFFSSAANVANDIDKQNGSAMANSVMAPFDGSTSRQNAFAAKSDSENGGHRHFAEVTLSAPAVSGLGYDILIDNNQLASVGDGSHRPDPRHHRLPIVQNDHVVDGNLARWFGSDVFHQNMPPLLAAAGQKVLTVDEIECWQHTLGKS